MCFYNDDPSQVWNEQTVKARKPYGCDDCSDGILPGEHYQRIGSLFDGSWSTIRVCARCHWDRHRVHLYELSEGCADWESWCPIGYLQEHMGELASNERWAKSNGGDIDPDDLPTQWGPSPITYRQEAA